MRNFQKIKKEKRARRHFRIRAKIVGTRGRPRFCVSRSSKHIIAQLIDDSEGRTLVFVSDMVLGAAKAGKRGGAAAASPKDSGERTRKSTVAYEVGKKIAEKAKELKIDKVVFDRGGYKYQGRIRALAEGARDSGLKF